jgi:hypothetical protein
VLGPGDEEKIRVRTSLLIHEDHDTNIKFKLTNFGRDPWTVEQGDYIGQLIMLGVDEVILDFIPFEDETLDLMGSTYTDDGDLIHRTDLGDVENALAAPAVASKKPWKEYQTQGGPETTKLYDPLLSRSQAEYYNRLLLESSWAFYMLRECAGATYYEQSVD